MPDMQIDKVIRSAGANQGKLSNMLASERPMLLKSGVWNAILQAIEGAFREDSGGDVTKNKNTPGNSG